MAGRKTHIMAIPLPLPGHITALLQLCRILTASNSAIAITFLNTDRYSHANFRNMCSEEINQNITFASLDFANPSEKPPSMGWGFLRSFLAQIDEVEAAAHRFVSSSLEQEPDMILSDVYIGWAQDMASQLGIPRIALWTSSASECLVYHYAPTLIARSILPFKVPKGCSVDNPDCLIEEINMDDSPTFHRVLEGSEDDIVVDIPGLPPLQRREFPSLLQVEDGDDIIFHGYIKQASRMAEADMVLLNTFCGLEAQVIEELKKVMQVVPIGPLFLMDGLHEYNNKEIALKKEGAKECIEWLDQQPEGSVVYVAFGTMLSMLESQVKKIAAGLEACGQPFLWSLRKGSAPLPVGFLERCKDRAMVVDWAPQTLILSHPSTLVFLSHCGWNSSLESLALGVPLLCCPRGGDQILNAKMIVEEWGLGLNLTNGANFLSAEGLTLAIKQLLQTNDNDGSFESKTRGVGVRERARALRHVISNSIDSIFNLDNNIAHLPSSQEALHSLLQFIASHGQSE